MVAVNNGLEIHKYDLWSSMGILVTWFGLWASVSYKICLTHILASPSIDGKGAPSIDSPFVLLTALSRDRLTTPQ